MTDFQEPKLRSRAILKLNISGRHYDIPASVAASHVGSIFALLASAGYVNSQLDEVERRRLICTRRIFSIDHRWFVERTPAIFEIILQYLYTLELHCPPSVCGKAVRDELKFWRLRNVAVAGCCCDDDAIRTDDCDEFGSVDMEMEMESNETKEEEEEENEKEQTQSQQDAAAMRRISTASRRQSLGDTLKDGLAGKRKRWRQIKRILWKMCHGPSSWMPARIFNGLSIFFITVSIVNLVLSTMPEFQCTLDASPADTKNISSNTTTNQTNITTSLSSAVPAGSVLRLSREEKFNFDCTGSLVFDIVEAVCIGWFTIELFLRFISFPDKILFLKAPMNIIDILATAPYYIELIIRIFGSNLRSVSTLMVVLRVLRMFRIIRVLRLARYFKSLKMFGETISKSREELGILVLFLVFSMVIFASVMYYLEKDVEGTPYISIPATFYWAVVTLTTTGYGDITPQTTLGKVLAGLACVTGVLILAFPVSILVEHFNEAYKARQQQRRRRYIEREQNKANSQQKVDFQFSTYDTQTDATSRGSVQIDTISNKADVISTNGHGSINAPMPATVKSNEISRSVSTDTNRAPMHIMPKRRSRQSQAEERV